MKSHGQNHPPKILFVFGQRDVPTVQPTATGQQVQAREQVAVIIQAYSHG